MLTLQLIYSIPSPLIRSYDYFSVVNRFGFHSFSISAPYELSLILMNPIYDFFFSVLCGIVIVVCVSITNDTQISQSLFFQIYFI